ncbi:MAG: galactose mutarotase [Oscillospiraceae bacterium]|jgi:aldose 1-epimerase|nr:galactose mutarotase [Oscillospiraceae bacterium]
MAAEKTYFGSMPDGREVSLYTLRNASGASVSLTDYGAALVEINVPDKDGRVGNVCLGYDTLEEYLQSDGYLGAVCGRVANRIDGGGFTLGGRRHEVPSNELGVSLHGGLAGFDKKLWSAGAKGEGVVFTYESPHGEEGFPGNLRVAATYTFNDGGELSIEYEYASDRDTIVNLTNHAYFNLAGHASGFAGGHTLQINARYVTPCKADYMVPDGTLLPVEDTPYDFTQPRRIQDALGERHPQLTIGNGFDINYALDGEGFRKVAALSHEAAGRVMECFTDLPGLQFYSGNFLTERKARAGGAYAPRCGLCLETQYFPNAVNTPGFAVPLLRAGRAAKTKTSYIFSAPK